MAVSKILMATGTLLLLHAAYSLQHYRSLIQDLEESSSGLSIDVEVTDSSVYRVPPVDVWVEMCLAFGILLVAEFTRTGSSLQPVATSKGGIKQKPMMAAPFVVRDFDIYTSRSRGWTSQ
jgi:hypothetical protein